MNIGRVPYYDWQGSPRSIVSEAALVAEVAFQAVDQRQRAIGQKIYRYFYVTIQEQKEDNVDTLEVIVESETLVPVVDALLSETSLITLKKRHIAYLQRMLLSLEKNVQQERDNQLTVLKRARRYRNENSKDPRNEVRSEKVVDTVERQEVVYDVEARLINIRLLV